MSRQMDLETASVEDIVDFFVSIAVKQNTALESFRGAEYNRLYELMERV